MFRIALLFITFGSAFMAWRIVAPLHLPPAATALGAGLVIALFALMLLQPLSWWRDDWLRTLARRLRGLSYGCMAFLSVLFALVLARDTIWIGTSFLDPWSIDLQRASSTAIVVLALLLTIYGHLEVRRGPRTVHVRIPIRDLPQNLAGIRIVQLSDLHVGESVRRPHIENLVAEVNTLGADLVAITGDLVDGSTDHLADHVEPLARLTSKHGTYFVAGNHDHYSGIASWIRQLRKFGFFVLVNEHKLIEKDGQTILIAGVDDWGATDDPAEDIRVALRDAPAKAVRILLAHHPKTALMAAPADFDLQLSGHTHGGQFIPWNIAARWIHRFSAGLYRVGKMWLYVSRGTFYWGPAVRIFAPAEITVLELAAQGPE